MNWNDTPEPVEPATIPDPVIHKEAARRRGAKRTYYGGGRPKGYRMSEETKQLLREKALARNRKSKDQEAT